MTITVQSVIDKIKVTLQDTQGIRWTAAELLAWLNDAQREIVLFKPDASATTAVIALAVGTRQTIPAAGNRLLRVVRNMSALSGGDGRRAVRLVERDSLDSQAPDWHSPAVTGEAAHTTAIKHYTYDEQDPRSFYVFPGVAGTTSWAEIVYSADLADVALAGNVSVPDIYANAIVDYVLFRAYTKDAEFAANEERAKTHYSIFMGAVGGKVALDGLTTPNLSRRIGPVLDTGVNQVYGQRRPGDGNFGAR